MYTLHMMAMSSITVLLRSSCVSVVRKATELRRVHFGDLCCRAQKYARAEVRRGIDAEHLRVVCR